MIYKKRPLKVDAERWYKVEYDRQAGQNTQPIYHLDVGHFRDPEVDGQEMCDLCNNEMYKHGWIDKYDGSGHVVCPEDWVVTEIDGSKVPYKLHDFEKSHEPNLAYAVSALRDNFERDAVVLIERVGSGMRFTPMEGDEEIIG